MMKARVQVHGAQSFFKRMLARVGLYDNIASVYVDGCACIYFHKDEKIITVVTSPGIETLEVFDSQGKPLYSLKSE